MFGPILVGLAAASVSLVRLWLGNPAALTEVLWAEDGLFPLCIHKVGFWECFTDPFAGYWLFLPRLLAWPVSLLPWEYWGIAMNLLAAVMVGATAALAVHLMHRAGMGWFVATAVGLLPAVAPMVGLEAINAVGSSYMLLLFLSTLAVGFPSQDSRGIWTAAMLLVTAMTIPSAAVLIPLVIVIALRALVRWRTALLWSGVLLVGLALQAWFAVRAESPRQVSFGLETLNAWANAVPVSLLTYWPGLNLAEYSFFDNFTLAPVAVTGWIVVLLLAAWGLWSIAYARGRVLSAGVLVLAGLGMGVIPAAIGFPNNRYFVVPLLLWGSAVLVLLNPVIVRARWWSVGLVTALVVLIWWPAMPASSFRSTPQPPWTAETERIEVRCMSEPDAMERPVFSPFWPPNWGDGLTEPTHPNLPCSLVWRWIN